MVSAYGNSNFMPPLLNTPTVQVMSTTFMPQNFYHHNAPTAPQSFYTSASNSMQQEQRPPCPPYRPSNRPILCYRCGEYGHYQSKCALPKGSPPCHHCPDSKDHYSKDCPKQRASSSSGSTQNQQEFTFPKINLITVNTIPQSSPATHVVNPQQVGESAGVLTRAQRAALGLSLPTSLSPPSPLPQRVSSDESFIGAKSKPNSMLSDIDGAFLEAVADLQQSVSGTIQLAHTCMLLWFCKSMASGTRHKRREVLSKNQPSPEQESSVVEEGEEEESAHSSHGATDMTSSDASDESFKFPSHMVDPDSSSQSDSRPLGRPQIDYLEFERHGAGGSSSMSSHYFDLAIRLKSEQEHQFRNIQRHEYHNLFNFINSKNLKILNLGEVQGPTGVAAVLEGPDDETLDPHLERIKSARDGGTGNTLDSDEEDEDFVAEKDDSGSPSDDSDEEGSDASEGGDEERPVKEKRKESAAPKPASARKKKREDVEGDGKKKRRKKDPNAPKRAISSFMYFSQAEREVLKRTNPGLAFKEVAKVLGERWKKLSEEEKEPYENSAKLDKVRYSKEMTEYRSGGQIGGNESSEDSE
ncbi:hypothetical protein L7F22_040907 [Adiantum nelumboides]|nr:hypothetical protein [Adiantum nelumboides]